jgi:hypothetical protein
VISPMDLWVIAGVAINIHLILGIVCTFLDGWRR